MNKLPSDFTLSRYGLDVRLVNEDDAEFIVKLRTDEKNSRFIHSTDCSVEKQREWIRNYKEREARGEDYYFVFSSNGKRVCLFRLYSINKKNNTFNFGSWVSSPDAQMQEPMLAHIIGLEIAFEDLQLDHAEITDGCHVDNTNVYKFSLMIGINYDRSRTIMDEKGEYYVGQLLKDDFYKGSKRIKRMFRL